jgi:acetyl-CoA acetyltransferase
MRDVFVIGVGMIKFGRYRDKDVHELAGEAARIALADAGMTINDIELMASGNLIQAGNMIGQRIMQQIGQTGIPVVNVRQRVRHRLDGVPRSRTSPSAAGEYEVAMAVGSSRWARRASSAAAAAARASRASSAAA